jgi:inosose dehydratase
VAEHAPGSARIAGAPISWGVCEAPGWGHQLPADRVLREMREVGLAATEIGPDGFLPPEPAAMAAVLETHRLHALGGFTPVLLHRPGHDPLPDVDVVLERFAATGSTVLVLAADSGETGYDSRPELDRAGWSRLTANLDRIGTRATQRGVRAVLHPHVGTMVETPDDVQRVLEGSSISLCLDTGHLLIGGCDPVGFARDHGERIVHVHLKDVDAAVAARYRAGELTLAGATQAGLFRPLGQGDARISDVLAQLDAHGYERWLVLEQDAALTGEEPPVGSGPVLDVQASIEYLMTTAPRRERVA